MIFGVSISYRWRTKRPDDVEPTLSWQTIPLLRATARYKDPYFTSAIRFKPEPDLTL